MMVSYSTILYCFLRAQLSKEISLDTSETLGPTHLPLDNELVSSAWLTTVSGHQYNPRQSLALNVNLEN